MFPQSEDTRYFRAIEAEFIRLRITPLQLSPDDFQIARAWRVAGVPLELTLEVLGEKIAAQRDKGQEVRRRLSYYRKAVLSAWEKRQILLAPAARPPEIEIDLSNQLQAIAAALPPELDEVAAAVRSLEGDPAEVEAALEVLEGRALKLLRQQLSAEEESRLAAEIAGPLADLQHRLPAEQLTRVAASLERQLLRQRGRLPTFSIFQQ